jgi:hypothetical protein
MAKARNIKLNPQSAQLVSTVMQAALQSDDIREEMTEAGGPFVNVVGMAEQAQADIDAQIAKINAPDEDGEASGEEGEENTED